MNRNQLLEDTMNPSRTSVVRSDSLTAGLRALRSRKSERRAKRMAAVAITVLAITVFGIFRHPMQAPEAIAPGRKEIPGITIIDRNGLFALFPNRPLALIGSPGDQQLVFLDQSPAR